MSVPIKAGRNKWVMGCLVPGCGLQVPVSYKVCDAHRNGPRMLAALYELRASIDRIISTVKSGKI